jgi:hypothetical protein
MMWFEELTGFAETSASDVRERLEVSGTTLRSRVNDRSWTCGNLEVVALHELEKRAGAIGASLPSRVTEVVADVQELHANPGNSGALFQVASQFNLLEMVSPSVTPERGVGIYENDFTQGPACAIAAGAGTIFRNYFAPTKGQVGQSASNQIDCLADLGAALGNHGGRLWEMRNGYALASANGLREISERLQASTPEELDEVRGSLMVGIQWGTQVTLRGCSHLVSQVYCSALPVAYSSHGSEEWKDFAVLILEAAYEATLCAGVINAQETGNKTVFLTLLGGGAFGNESSWIVGAMERALQTHAESGLDVRIVSFGSANPALGRLAEFCE